jgi:hypothetical protein
MFYNIGYKNTTVIYCHSMVITEVVKHYNTEFPSKDSKFQWKKFYNIGQWCQYYITSFYITTEAGKWAIEFVHAYFLA